MSNNIKIIECNSKIDQFSPPLKIYDLISIFNIALFLLFSWKNNNYHEQTLNFCIKWKLTLKNLIKDRDEKWVFCWGRWKNQTFLVRVWFFGFDSWHVCSVHIWFSMSFYFLSSLEFSLFVISLFYWFFSSFNDLSLISNFSFFSYSLSF